jgi:hypothetical protein
MYNELNIDITEEDGPMHVNKDKIILHLADITISPWTE